MKGLFYIMSLFSITVWSNVFYIKVDRHNFKTGNQDISQIILSHFYKTEVGKILNKINFDYENLKNLEKKELRTLKKIKGYKSWKKEKKKIKITAVIYSNDTSQEPKIDDSRSSLHITLDQSGELSSTLYIKEEYQEVEEKVLKDISSTTDIYDQMDETNRAVENFSDDLNQGFTNSKLNDDHLYEKKIVKKWVQIEQENCQSINTQTKQDDIIIYEEMKFDLSTALFILEVQ